MAMAPPPRRGGLLTADACKLPTSPRTTSTPPGAAPRLRLLLPRESEYEEAGIQEMILAFPNSLQLDPLKRFVDEFLT